MDINPRSLLEVISEAMQHSCVCWLTVRHFSRIAFSQKTELKLRQSDGVGQEFRLVYRAPMTGYVTTAQATSTISMLLLGAVGLYKASAGIKLPPAYELGPLLVESSSFAVLIASFALFNAGICSITLRYPLRMYHHEKAGQYIAVMQGFTPLATHNLNFKAGDVSRATPVLSSMLPWKDAIFKIRDRTVFIIENGFRTPSELDNLLRKL
ncbi:uncharacterized protein [Periplaneta americana]|uniref:uncharacterized protein n=1 Tax=Periplaneta americana TaxID=6978 RepID=UPI0037E7EFE2